MVYIYPNADEDSCMVVQTFGIIIQSVCKCSCDLHKHPPKVTCMYMQWNDWCTYAHQRHSMHVQLTGSNAECPLHEWLYSQFTMASSLQPVHCGQFTAASSLRPAHCGQLTAASSLRPAHCGQLTAASSLRPAHCGQLTAASSLRPAHCGQFTTTSSLRPVHYGQFTTASSLRPVHYSQFTMAKVQLNKVPFY